MTRPEIQTMICKQCGMTHPPLSNGTRCPMAKHATSNGDEIDYGNFLANLQNIVASQIDIKKIIKPKNMFAKLTVEFMKLVENYEEESVPELWFADAGFNRGSINTIEKKVPNE